MGAVKAPPPFTTKDSNKQCLCQEVLSIFDEGEGNLARLIRIAAKFLRMRKKDRDLPPTYKE
ncbi:MAG: hypothetical protein HYY81_05790 [Deltaproteobacteria bacterium]|nr:hypothetical protein [Deltaproteobacteria bacterium]